jgi:hypothetical protein
MITTNLLVNDDVIRIINQIVKLPDEAVVDAGLAALYLGSSEKSLARYRQHGEGPPYHQYPEGKSKARNQKVNYEMGDLRKWRTKNKITSAMDAAVRRGMAFSRVNDLLPTQPFWTAGDVILNHAMDSDDETFIQHLKDPESSIAWLSWPKAFECQWKSNEYRSKFQNPYVSLLSKLLETAMERHE